MTKASPRSEAIAHLKAALATGVRGAAREALLASLDALTEADDRGDEIADLHVRRLKPKARLFDPRRPGFIARMGADGCVVWMYRYRALDGTAKQTELRFGRTPEMSLAEARKIWAGLRAQRLRGEEPSILREETGLTVGELIDLYLVHYVPRAKKPGSLRVDTRLLEKHLRPLFGLMPVASFGAEQANAALRPLIERDTPVEAAHLKACCSAMWNIGLRGSRKVDLGAKRWLPETLTNPWTVVSVPFHKPDTYIPRDRAELRRFVRAVLAVGPEGDALWLQALTGCRINEIVGAVASEVDIEARVWTIPAARMKAGEAHRVMLSPAAWEVVSRRLEMAREAGREHLFGAKREPRRLMATDVPQKLLQSLRSRADLPDGFSTHAMRRAMATWVAEHGASKDVRDRLLAHVDRASVDARYSRAALDRPAAEWWAKWADFLVGLQADNVVRIDEVSET
jgi:integrase